MKKFRLWSLAGSFLFISISLTHAQTIPGLPVHYPVSSTRAKALIESVMRPSANYFHGKTDIVIPLYTIEAAGVTIPIYLSYDHKGFKANNFSEWLGQGWNLNAEPMITIAVNNKPDHKHTLISPEDQSVTRNSDYIYKLANPSFYDEYPDTYFYNLPGKSGMFMKRWDNTARTWTHKTIPYEPLKITDYGDAKTFEIIDDNGVFYRFGVSMNGVNAYESNLEPYFNNYCWRGTEIVSADKKETVRFTYDSQKEWRGYINDMATVEDNNINSSYSWGTSLQNPPFTCESYPVIKETNRNANGYIYCNETYDMYNNVHYNYEVRWYNINCQQPGSYNHYQMDILINKKITFDNGEVEFITTGKKLERILVRNAMGTVVRNILFTHTTGTYPLLNSIIIKGADGETIDKYDFAYNGEPVTRNNYSRGFNFWGYAIDFTSLNSVPTTVLPIYHREGYSSINKTSNNFYRVGEGSDKFQPASNKGLLKSVTNALGGLTEFFYEPDSYVQETMANYYNPNNTTVIIKKISTGGNRIKQIKETDPYTQIVKITDIKYGDFTQRWDGNNGGQLSEENGCGIIRWHIVPESYMSTQNLDVRYSPTEGKLTRLRTLYTHLIASNSHLGMPISYPIVTEYVSYWKDGMVDSGYKTVYNYNAWATPSFSPTYAPYKYPQSSVAIDSHTDWHYGQLVLKEEYDKQGNRYTLKLRNEYTYTLNTDAFRVGQSYQQTVHIRPTEIETYQANVGAATYVTHFIFGGTMNLTRHTETSYTDNGQVVVQKDYTYDPVTNYPLKETFTSSDGSIMSKEYKYVNNMTTAPYTTMKARNIISPIVQETYTNNDRVYTMIKTDYSNSLSGNTNLFAPSIVSYGRNNGSLEARIKYHKYDDYGNPLYATKDDVTNMVYLWGYGYKYPVAEIRNATYDEVITALGGQSVANSLASNRAPTQAYILNTLKPLINRLPNAQVSIGVYSPPYGIIVSIDPTGQTFYYDYDSAGRLKSIKDDKQSIVEEYNYHISNN